MKTLNLEVMEDFFCATIGNYDGVHRGHQKVLEKVRLLAKDRGQKTMVVTFDKHPMEVICPERAPHPILSLDERVRKLKENKIDNVTILSFNREFMQQTAYDFMENVLYKKLGVRTLVIGYDNRFGKRNPEENAESYINYGKQIGIEVVIGPKPEECGLYNGKPICSSLIRQMIREGNNEEAKLLL